MTGMRVLVLAVCMAGCGAAPLETTFAIGAPCVRAIDCGQPTSGQAVCLYNSPADSSGRCAHVARVDGCWKIEHADAVCTDCFDYGPTLPTEDTQLVGCGLGWFIGPYLGPLQDR